MKPLAIIGLGPTHDDAPWENEGWERWGLAWDAYAPRCHFLFEMHAPDLWPEMFRSGYRERLRDHDAPIYMQAPLDDIPGSIEYPLEEVVQYIKRDYFGSSIAYMIGLAIRQHRRHIGLWGVDLDEDIYDHQKPNLAWLVGLAMGSGIAFDGPSLDSILSYEPVDPQSKVSYPLRYGTTEESQVWPSTLTAH